MAASYFWSTRWFLASLESIGLSVQEKRKIDFQDGGQLGFPIGMILAIFDLFLIYVIRCFLASLESIGLSVQEEKRKIYFQDGGHLGFPIGTILAIFDLQVTQMLPTKFGVNWPFGSGEEAKNRFSRWRPSWISDRNDFRIFNLQVTLMIPTKYQVNLPRGVGGVGF